MRTFLRTPLGTLGVFLILVLLHASLLRLPYFWDEAGYYIPAALDFYRHGLLIPRSTLPTGHTPLVMIYLGLAWRLFGFSPLVTRAAMVLVAAGTIVALWKLARQVAPASREAAAWGIALLALSPLFFAQSSLAHLDLAVALFTTLAVAALLRRQAVAFALAASLAVLSKETAVIVLPVAWLFAAWRWREKRVLIWLALASPLLPLIAWTLYYHHSTGFWTGNAGYLKYNLYSTLHPLRILFSFTRRFYEVFIGGFDWLLAAGAVFGLWWTRRSDNQGRDAAGSNPYKTGQKAKGKRQKAKIESAPNPEFRTTDPQSRIPDSGPRILDFFFLTVVLAAAYLAMLSVVGGAILPRYLLPVFPVLYLAAATLVLRLPRLVARVALTMTLAGFIAAWFINPPYPFPFEDNLAYADFIHLHQQAARFLERRDDAPRILTAWPASDELRQPDLGYVTKPLRVVPIEGFANTDFAQANSNSFDLLLFYSRKWEPPGNWLTRFRPLGKMQQPYFDYAPQVAAETLTARFHLELVAHFERRGQWVDIYARQPDALVRR